eukprot:Polyplicarium_translucidae@DN968_c0_g1_i1.p1
MKLQTTDMATEEPDSSQIECNEISEESRSAAPHQKIRVSKDVLKKAFTALAKYDEGGGECKARDLLHEAGDKTVLLKFSLSHIPHKATSKAVKIRLARGIWDGKQDTCLIVKDKARWKKIVQAEFPVLVCRVRSRQPSSHCWCAAPTH